jgi:hypothetical protein
VNFLADMGERPAGTSIERIDNNGDYEPNNCKWATRKEQGNNKRSNRRIEFNGETLTLSQWSRKIGVKPATLGFRLRSGWPMSRAMSEPAVVGKNQSFKQLENMF